MNRQQTYGGLVFMLDVGWMKGMIVYDNYLSLSRYSNYFDLVWQ